jgi:hypothetical protein
MIENRVERVELDTHPLYIDRLAPPLSDGPSIYHSKLGLEPAEPKTRCTPLREQEPAETARAGQWIEGGWGNAPLTTNSSPHEGHGRGGDNVVRVHGARVRIFWRRVIYAADAQCHVKSGR